MTNKELFNESHDATYCPEDDKLRLYVGRVEREEYLALKKEGWTSTPKQECDFVAKWTTSRENTALSYAGIILDEDQSPAERAVDRAERFAGYREKRREEAHGHADSYDAGPAVHGFQSHTKAAMAADRHDRKADKAIDAWSKAEYWTRRTDGVIGNALYKSSPSVRMGRIKKIESEIRRYKKERSKNENIKNAFQSIVEKWGDDTESATEEAKEFSGRIAYGGPSLIDRATGKSGSIYSLLNYKGVSCALVSDLLSKIYDGKKGRYESHAELRLSYERQMLEAAGGRAGAIEIKIGGTFTGGVIAKVNKSNSTGRVVSVAVIVPAVEGWAHKVSNTKGTDFALMQIDVERANPDAYKEPTETSLLKLKEYKEAVKASKKTAPKLVNPTPEEAQRLQFRLNSDVSGKQYRNTPAEVVSMTQEQYSYKSKGSDWVGTELHKIDGQAFKVRSIWNMGAHAVICITDKPQKKLPEFASVKPVEEKVDA